MSPGFLPVIPIPGLAAGEDPAEAGDTGIFEATLRKADAALRQYLQRHLGTADHAADAVQETYLRMLRYRGLTNAVEIQALLFHVARTVVTDQFRRAQSRHAGDHDPLDDSDLPSAQPALERVVQGHQDLSKVKAAIRDLPPRCRQVFLLHRFEGLSYKEIARRFGTSERTVEHQVAAALAACRAAIGDERR